MSLVQRIAYGGRRNPRKTGHKKPGLFNLWSRKKSDELRYQICRLLGVVAAREEHVTDHPPRAYSMLLQLPTPVVSGDTVADLSLELIQARALFTKDEDLVSDIDREAAAYQSFLESEETCRSLNDKLLSGQPLPEKGAEPILMIARRKIEAILGECPTLEDLPVAFGPGAAATCRKRTSARWKLSTPPSISRSAAEYGVSRFAQLVPRWVAPFGALRVTVGELDFVPKNYKTHRSIVMEPSLTGALQRAVGTVLKRKLLRAGIDLTDQRINRERARLGSLFGTYATLDLSRASDSISYALVMELLPKDWFELLDSLRTPVVRYKNTLIELEKFSSMGNGYTFELESLLFYVLADAVAVHLDLPRDISVYGDDIIVPPNLGRALLDWLPVFGFTPNAEKSFLEGPFRESCGFDSFLGIDVRPYYLKGRFTYHRVMSFHNFLQRKPWFDPNGTVRELLRGSLPPYFRIWGPDGYGDGHLVSGDPASTLKPWKRKDGWGGFIFETFSAIPHEDREECPGDELLPSYAAEASGLGWSDSVYHLRSPRGVVPKHRKTKVYVLGVA